MRVFFRVTHRDITTFRLIRPGTEVTRFTSHPFLPYAERPNASRSITARRSDTGEPYTVEYHLNSRGFRGNELPFRKPEGVKRIVCLGGSTTFSGRTDAETWPARLEARLRGRGLNVEVINMGVDMGMSPMSLVNLELVGLEYGPDLVISADGINDSQLVGRPGIAPDYRNALADLEPEHLPWQSTVPRWLLDHSYLVAWATCRMDGGRADLPTRVLKVNDIPFSQNQLEGVEYFERNLRLMRAASREYGARFLAVTSHWAEPSDKAEALNDELRRFYAREGIDYLDVESLLPPGHALHSDGVHWTEEGADRVAALFEEKIVAGGLLR